MLELIMELENLTAQLRTNTENKRPTKYLVLAIVAVTRDINNFEQSLNEL